MATGLNPISVYGVMWNGTFMNTTRFSWALRDLSSLLCIAIALAPAFKMRFWNIGGEGQVLIGGLAAALIMVYFGSSLPAPLGFGIVGVSLDNNLDKWKEAITALDITWPQMSDLQGWNNAGAKLYGVNSIPATVLVDQEGTIVARNLRGEDIKAKLSELLK